MPLHWNLAAALCLVYLGFVAAGQKNLLKVGPALLLAFAVLPAGFTATAAFVACAAGDAFLLSKDRYFLHGLAAFLLGHLLFVVDFALRAQSQPPLPLAALMVLAAGGVLWRILPSLSGVLRIAVPVYAFALGAMVVWAGAVSSLAMAGAVIFVVSDSVLALNRFARPLQGAEMIVMTTYYAALLTISAALIL